MKKNLNFLMMFGLCLLTACSTPNNGSSSSEVIVPLLKDVYANYFPIGAALTENKISLYEDLLPNFNSITQEYEAKWSITEPLEGQFDFSSSDPMVEYAKENGKGVRGHTLVWYKSLPRYVLSDNPSKEKLISRIENHVEGVINHFKDDVYVWDVVNEALRDYPSLAQVESGDFYRTGDETNDATGGDLFAICGIDYIESAFKEAYRVRQENNYNFKLFYNDYGLNYPNKREALLKMLDQFALDGTPIEGVGLQAHYYLGSFNIDEFENTIRSIVERGLDVQITELDVSIYPYSTYPITYDEIPESLSKIQASMYGQIMGIARKYSHPENDAYGKVTGVTMWGVADDITWLDNNPVSGRKNWPLLFDEFHEPKQAFWSFIDLDKYGE